MAADESKKSFVEQYAELSKNSLIRVQFPCGGNSTSIEEPEYIPIVDEPIIYNNFENENKTKNS